MTFQQEESIGRLVKEHRNIYRFGGPWARALLASVPWINALALTLFIIAVHGKIAVEPGLLFDLPREPLHEDLRTDLTAMMIPVAGEGPSNGQGAMVFFDDERFLTGDKTQMEILADHIRQRATRDDCDATLLLMADKRVRHGEVIDFVNLARGAGVKRIHVASKPE